MISEFNDFNQEKAEQLEMPWQTKFEELRTYIRSEYLEVHMSKRNVKRVEQIQRNIEK